jgi:uncharacterized protein YggE
MRRTLPLLPLAFLAALTLPAFAGDAAPQRTISIDGKGEVTTAPDTAFVNAGVTSTATTAREALTDNTRAMADLIATLKTAGVAAADIQTSGFSVNPQYFYADRDAQGNTPPPRITGYQVQNGVNVRVRKLADLGTILDQIVSVGANTINGVNFTVDDPAKLLDEARKAAFADAEAKAKTYADAAGIGLGEVLTIAERNTDNAPRPYAVRAMAAPMADKAVPVEAGQLTYDVDVSVQWALQGDSN